MPLKNAVESPNTRFLKTLHVLYIKALLPNTQNETVDRRSPPSSTPRRSKPGKVPDITAPKPLYEIPDVDLLTWDTVLRGGSEQVGGGDGEADEDWSEAKGVVSGCHI